MLKVEHVQGGYEGKPIIREVSFEVQTGSFFVLLGPNGSGKSTLFKLITGVLPLTSGQVEIGGCSLSSYSAIERAKKIAVLPQEERISFDFTVEEIVYLGRYPHQRGWFKTLTAKDLAVVEEALEVTQVTRFRQTPFRALSGGEKQRVLLAKALAQEPELLFLDEPTNHLDVHHTLHILNVIKDWQKTRKMTVVAILHDLNIASLYADQIGLLKEGELVAIGDVELFKDSSLLQEVYQVDILSYAHPSLPKPQLVLASEELMASQVEKHFFESYQLTQTEEVIHIQFDQTLRTISNGVMGEGIQWANHFCNFHVNKDYNCSSPYEDVLGRMKGLGIPHEKAIGMMTAVQLEDMVLLEEREGEYSFIIMVTSGTGNARDITKPIPAAMVEPIGTINTMLFIDGHLSDGALINAFMSATEAKAKALQEMQIMDPCTGTGATGTSTDSLLIATSQKGVWTPYAGSGTKIGMGIGRIVHQAITQATRKYLQRKGIR